MSEDQKNHNIKYNTKTRKKENLEIEAEFILGKHTCMTYSNSLQLSWCKQTPCKDILTTQELNKFYNIETREKRKILEEDAEASLNGNIIWEKSDIPSNSTPIHE